MAQDFDREQLDIVTRVLDLNENKGRAWYKFNGDVTNRIIVNKLQPYVEKFRVVGPNAYIKNFSTEFDGLIVEKNVIPAPDTNCF